MPETQVGGDVEYAAHLLRAGRLVAIPTETVYGLAADALNPEAVAAVFEAKQRPAFDPLIVHVPDRSAAGAVVEEFPLLAERLSAAFWPGPLTLVLPRRPCIPDLVTSGLPGVGVRVPAHPLTRQLLRATGCTQCQPLRRHQPDNSAARAGWTGWSSRLCAGRWAMCCWCGINRSLADATATAAAAAWRHCT